MDETVTDSGSGTASELQIFCVGFRLFNSINGEIVMARLCGCGYLPFMLVMLAAVDPAQAVLYKYDDFSSAPASNSLWTVESLGDGSVLFDGGLATIDMAVSTQPKHARIAANGLTPGLALPGDTFRISWDMQIVNDGTNGFTNGLAFVLGTANVQGAGQFGNASNIAAAQRRIFINGTESGADFGTAKLHYDLTVTLNGSNQGNLALNVYDYNAAYDDSPLDYEAETALTTRTANNVAGPTGFSWLDDGLKVVFYANNPVGNDVGAAPRSAISIDNVYSSVFIPEPGANILLVMGVIGLYGTYVRRQKKASTC